MYHIAFLTLVIAALGAKGAKQPNIVWILADDLNNDYKQDRLALMPNLAKIKAAGAHFVNHAAVQPVCGPSRSSLLSGRFPHNVGYVCNSDKPSVNNYLAVQNNSVGAWLTAAGYHTAFIGKYVNGLEHTVPSGWNFWGGFSSAQGTYNYFNSTPYNVTFDRTGQNPTSPVEWVAMTGTHQSDFVGQWGVQQMGVAVKNGLPFFVHLTPLMIHYGVCYGPLPKGVQHSITDPFWENNLTQWGCNNEQNRPCSLSISPCPSLKNAHAFDGRTNPHTPAYNVSASGPLPSAMSRLPVTSTFTSSRQDVGFRNRSAALLDLDSLLGVVLDGIQALDVAKNTYLIFSSDNGYHLGEHKMNMGKEHPYETDVSLPMYILGPGVPANAELLYPTNHIDITATVVELAGATPIGPPLDGLSFAAAFGPSPPAPADWRNFQFSEHHCDAMTWRKIRRPLAGENSTYHMWCDGVEEVFEAGDPWQLANTVQTTGASFAEANKRLAEFLWQCSGPECNTPTPQGVKKFPCYNTTGPLHEFDP